MAERSHLTQIYQNYFDSTDVRSRESTASLEAQLLNLAAASQEDLVLRVARETTQTIQTVPLNLDNFGVYYSSTVPQAFLTGPDQTTFNSVVADLNGTQITLTLYDDTLPIPSRILVNGSNTIAIANPQMFEITGSGDDQAQIYTVQYVEPGSFPIENKLTLWVDQVGLNQLNITLTIIGETAPQPAWASERRKTTEVLTITGEGYAITRHRWALIDKIGIRGLPTGVRLRGWSMPFNLPAVIDTARQYTTPEDRDVLYDRYWSIDSDNKFINEMFMAEGFTGLETVNTYATPELINDIAIEPFTYGIFIASGTKLYYGDRREYQADMTETGLAIEPLFGLQVVPDNTQTGGTKYVILSGTPYASANNIFQYRYTVNGTNSILPDGSLGPINAGWRGGAPQPVSFALLTTGDYQFRLEMQDSSGITTFDVVPYKNASFTSLKSIDLSAFIDIIKSIAYDSYGTLWVWNGAFAIPLDIHYDGYVFDADSKTIFVTEPFDSLQIS